MNENGNGNDKGKGKGKRERNVYFTFPKHVHATGYMIEEEGDIRAPMVCR